MKKLDCNVKDSYLSSVLHIHQTLHKKKKSGESVHRKEDKEKTEAQKNWFITKSDCSLQN